MSTRPTAAAAKRPRRAPTTHEAMLQWTPGEIKKLLKTGYWRTLHSNDHPVPFLSNNVLRNLNSTELLLKHFDLDPNYQSPGCPRPEEQQPLGDIFDIRDAAQFLHRKAQYGMLKTVQDLARRLYECCPILPKEFLQYNKCLAIVCQALAHNHKRIRGVIPVEITTSRTDQKLEIPRQYAALITWARSDTEDTHFLLPISLQLLGSTQDTRTAIAMYLKRRYSWQRTSLHGTSDSVEHRELGKIFEKFQNHPVLLIRDVFMFARNGGWQPRRFEDACFVQLKMPTSGNLHGKAKLPHENPELERYTDLHIMLKCLSEQWHPVEFRNTPPTTPFDKLSVDDFHLRAMPPSSISVGSGQFPEGSHVEDDVEEILPDKPLYICDRQATCEIINQCNLPWAGDSRYCVHHSAKLLEAFRRMTFIPADMTIDFRHNRLLDPGSRGVYNSFLRMFETRDKRSRHWIIDTEFQVLVGQSAVCMSIAIRDLNGMLVLDTTVDYESKTREQMINEVQMYLTRSGGSAAGLDFKIKAFERCFDKHYTGPKTHGRTVDQIRQKIIQLGYTPQTHTLLSWVSVMDYQIFQRMMAGGNQVVSPKVKMDHFINVWLLAKKMLPSVYVNNGGSAKLEFLHRLCFPNSRLTYHAAADDTQAMYDLMRLMHAAS